MHSENSKHKRRRLRHVLFCDRWPDERVGIKVRNWIYQYNSGQIHKKYFLHATNEKKHLIKRSSGHTWNELQKGKWKTRNAESGVWKIKSSGGKIKKKKERNVSNS